MIKKIFSWFMTLALMLVTILALMIFAIPKVLGAVPLTVYTSSMVPIFNPGDLIIVKPLNNDEKEQLDVGDIVTFQPVSGDPTLITHRIIEKQTSTNGIKFVTLGDANGSEDDPIISDQVMAKYLYKIPYMGKFTYSGGSNPMMFYGIACLFIVFGFVTMLLPGDKKKKKSKDENNEDNRDKENVKEIDENENVHSLPDLDNSLSFKNPYSS